MDKKAAICLPTNPRALGPVMAITMVEAVLPALTTLLVSYLGCAVRANPGLKVVSSTVIVFREWQVGMPCTNISLTGVSR